MLVPLALLATCAAAVDIVLVNEDSDVFADGSRVPCQVGGDCQDLGWCDDTADGAWCRGESRTWWVIGHDVSRGCEWVSEDPDARCWARGRHAELDCANDATVADERCRAGQESEIPNFKGSSLGRFPLVSADFWTSDHLSERFRSVNASSGTRARRTLTLKRR